MLIELITLAAFLGIVGLVFFLRALVVGWQGDLSEQLAAEAEGISSGPIFGDLTEPLAAQIPPIIGTQDELTHDLRKAGYYKPSARSEFLAIRNLMAISVIVLTGIYAVMVGPERREFLAQILIWGLAIAALVYTLPWLYLRFEMRRRLSAIQRALPDAFDMLTMALSGGLSVPEALGHVSREIVSSHPDLAVELEIVRRHAEMTTLGDAFRQFARRIDIPEVANLTSIVTQSERLGSNVVMAVRDYADAVRLKNRQMADDRANKASLKMLFPIVFCIAPAAMIILWGPAILELRNFFRSFKVPV